jgi:S-(hydroxymethyl)glutathione dehydrogenase/alcohol dehydrogenase
MKTRAALLWESPGKWDVREIELDEPKAHEVLVRMVAAGLCHSDDHVAKGDAPVAHLPRCGGHEGAGVIEAVGPHVRGLKVGDHVVTSFVPGCGRCRWCAQGMQNLCDNGALLTTGAQFDGTFRMHADGHDVAQAMLVSTFSEYSVMPEWSCVPIAEDIPLEIAALLGCGVPTGWGSAVYLADVRPGDVVIVMGAGGIGINAVQGAAHAGAQRVIAVDPAPFKRDMALRLGATHSVDTMAEATELARAATNGQGADSAIVTVGVLTGDDVAAAFDAIGKGGTVVVTAIGKVTETNDIPVSPGVLSMYQKRIQGSLYGGAVPTADIPLLLEMWRAGRLELEELATRTYTLDEVAQGFEDMHAGINIRGVIHF